MFKKVGFFFGRFFVHADINNVVFNDYLYNLTNTR